MKENKYSSHIKKPVVHISASGARSVLPFDVIRSESGRAVVRSLAAQGEFKSPKVNDPPSPLDSDKK